LRQVLFNLLSNAAKFTDDGSVFFDVAKVQLDGANLWQFKISDTGIGIAADKMDRLFEEFSQLDADMAHRHDGTGLGLAISQRFCRMLGGEITVTSQPGKGSTFIATLPDGMAEQSKVQAGSPNQSLDSKRAWGNEHCNVLVIDDDHAVRDLMSRYLAKEGFSVQTASTGDEGVLAAQKLHPDAITLDLLMPGVDGWSVLTQLKADPELANIPVVIVSILDDQDMGYTLGAADYLIKPIDQQHLARIMRRYCDKQTRAPILVVEDDEVSRNLVCNMLEKEGWDVVAVEDAESGLAEVDRQQPALILLDLILPGMDGFEFIEALHINQSWNKIPIVVVTAKDLSPDEHDFLNRSVRMIMKKGVYSRRELLDIVRGTMPDSALSEDGAKISGGQSLS
jgi:CheY-like chemotaxis protein